MTEPAVGATKKSELTASSIARVSLKRPYERPLLRMYGNIATLTDAVGKGIQTDGIGMSGKTH